MANRHGFFVMLRYPKGFPIPMVDEEEDIKLFGTREEADNAGKRNMFGETFGYEIYEWN
jgi:hypothetical protein